MSSIVAISCARAEAPHGEMLKAFLEEELGEPQRADRASVVAPDSPPVFFYLATPPVPIEFRDVDAPARVDLPETIERIYNTCTLMAAIIGEDYVGRPIVARESQILAERAADTRSRLVSVTLIDNKMPPELGVALRKSLTQSAPKNPLSSTGFDQMRAVARDILALLGEKKPPHPRETRRPPSSDPDLLPDWDAKTVAPIRRHLPGLLYVFGGRQNDGSSLEACGAAIRCKEATEAVLSTGVLLGRLQQAQRAASVARALKELGATAANESSLGGRGRGTTISPGSFTKLQRHANHVLRQLATADEEKQLGETFPLSLRVKLLVRLEHYLTRHTIEKLPSCDADDASPLAIVMETMQDIVLPNPNKYDGSLSGHIRPVLHENVTVLAQNLWRCQWLADGKTSQVVPPQDLRELESFRRVNELELVTTPRRL